MDDNRLVLADDTTQDLMVRRVPQVVIDEGRRASKALTDIVEAAQNKLVLNGKQYLYFEHWQTLGRFYGITAKIAETKFVELEGVHGFEARAVALHHGLEISAAEAVCLTDEPNWRGKPLFQLKSMAQTRAAAKALRTVLAWVVVLAGYEPTPAEEMPEEATPKAPKAGKPSLAERVLANAGVTPTAQVVTTPDNPLRIVKVESKPTKKPGVQRHRVVFNDGRVATTIKDFLAGLAHEYQKAQAPVQAVTKSTEWGLELSDLIRLDEPPDHTEPLLTDKDIPF